MQTDRDAGERANLLRLCADRLDEIETNTPADAHEARDQAFFFLSRGLENVALPVGRRHIDLALMLSRRHFDVDSPEQPDLQPTQGRHGSGSIVAYVTLAPERVSLIDRDYRYVATSAPNADFYRTRSIRLVGTHLAKVIGRQRFEGRARRRLDKCFAGAPQDYWHTIEAPEGGRVMSCQMKPVRLETGEIEGAIVYMRDVTSDLPEIVSTLTTA